MELVSEPIFMCTYMCGVCIHVRLCVCVCVCVCETVIKMIIFHTSCRVYPMYTLGYSKSPKFREWITDLSVGELKKIEADSKSANDLAKSLFMKLYKEDLEQRPDGHVK